MELGERMQWAAPVAQLITAGLAVYALYKATKSEKDDKSAARIDAESKARESLAIRYDREIKRCSAECDELREELGQERKLRRILEEKLDDQAAEIRKLKRQVADAKS